MKIDWKKTLGTVAPAIATALGGPLAGVAVGMAAKALGLGEGATEEDLQVAVLGSTPETLLKLKECDNNFKVEMGKLGVDIERINAGDRDSARNLAIKTTLLPQMGLGVLFTAGFIFVLYTLFSGEEAINSKMLQPAMYTLGILSAGMIQIMNFFFGSSAGSSKKSETIANLKGQE
jgi:hypothetical protein